MSGRASRAAKQRKARTARIRTMRTWVREGDGPWREVVSYLTQEELDEMLTSYRAILDFVQQERQKTCPIKTLP